MLILSRGVVSRATYNRRVRKEATAVRNNLINTGFLDERPTLHWLDNYAKCYAAHSIFVNKETFRSMLWTAHGVKKLQSTIDLAWIYDAKHSVPALPQLPTLLHSGYMEQIFTQLASYKRMLFEESFVVSRDVRRIPLKPLPHSEEEKIHLQSSTDGLRFFHPVDIYPHNIGSSIGLLEVLRRLQLAEGFGLKTHLRRGSYTLLHCDVAIFWQTLRLLYCYSGMAPLRHDLGLCLGFWHPYMYCHVAMWDTFRETFLAPAYFCLFPSQKLLRRPRLKLVVPS